MSKQSDNNPAEDLILGLYITNPVAVNVRLGPRISGWQDLSHAPCAEPLKINTQPHKRLIILPLFSLLMRTTNTITC